MAEVTPEGASGKLKVFISYSRRDALDFAQQLKAALEAFGHEPLLDVHGIAGGENWQERLGALILEADTVVFVLTPESAGSNVCRWEVEQTQRLAKRLIPIAALALGDAKPPSALSARNYIHFYAEKSVPGSGFGYGLQRLIAALVTDLDWIREHTRITAAAERWQDQGRGVANDALLIGRNIDLAEGWLAARPANAPDPPAIVIEFIRASRAAADTRTQQELRQLAEMRSAQEAREAALVEKEVAQRQAAEASRRVVRSTLFGAVAALSLAILSAVVAYYAVGQTREAQRSRETATKNRDAALLSQSQYLADLAKQKVDQGESGTGLLLALEALQDQFGDSEIARVRPYWDQAEVSLEASIRSLRELILLKGHSEQIKSVALTPDGSRIVTASQDTTVRIWDATSGADVGALKGHTGEINAVTVTADGLRIVTGSSDGTARIWDAKTGAELVVLKIQISPGKSTDVWAVAVTQDGARILTGSSDGSVRIWD